jgi:predicted small lipoprotein YifL
MNLRIPLILALLLVLVACGRGGPPKRIHPPAAAVQELAVQPDGTWRLSLRLQSFSTVGTEFQAFDLELAIDGEPAGRLQNAEPRTVPGQSAEVYRLTLDPEPGAARALTRLAESGRPSFPWTLRGNITVAGRVHRNEFQGRLSPVPGLADTYR